MTREIKFRVWDNEEKKFFEPTYEGYAGKVECLTISLAGRLTKRTFNQPAIDESCFEGRYILSQFTGLKDKNGKEIFEGDVVNWFRSKLVVEFRLGNFGAAERNRQFKSLLNIGYWVNPDILDDFVVMGNIYENPELLEGK